MVRFAFIFISLLVGLALQARAEEPKFTAYSRILTYRQLMRLPEPKRLEYLEGVRAMMAEIEQLSYQTAKMDPEQTERLNAYLQLMRATVGTAEAATPSRYTGRPESREVSFFGFNKHLDWSCTDNPAPNTPSIIATQVPGTNVWACRSLSVVNETCARGFVAVLQRTDGRFLCYSSQSFETLASNVKSRLRTPTSTRVTQNLRQAFERAGPPIVQPAAASPAAPPKRLQVVVAPPPDEVPDRRAPPARPSDRPTRAEPRRTTGRVQPGESPPPSAAAPTVDSNEEFTAFVLESCPNAAEPTGLTCNRTKINEAKRALKSRAGGTPNSCFYAGHVRPYRNNRVAPRNCEPISEFCSESDTCRDSLTGQKNTPRFKCGSTGHEADAGKILCNPLIFGFRRDDQSPYCVSAGANATRACDELSSSEQQVGGAPTRFEWVAGTPDIAMDQATMDKLGISVATREKAAGFKEMWDQFARSINNMCVEDKDLRQAFCVECEVVRKRAVAMNMQAGLQSEGVKVCTALLEFQKHPELKFRGEAVEAGSVTAAAPPAPPAPAAPPAPPREASMTLIAAPGAVADPALAAGPTAVRAGDVPPGPAAPASN